jgi:phosphonate transport system ATP-binding protein
MSLFELKHANAAYDGEVVLHDISLRIERGERVAFVGQSGAGKSTLLSLLYEQNGVDSALVPQDLGLVQALSVFHNIYMAHLHEHRALYNLVNLIRPLRREVDAVMPIIERLGLEDKVFTPVGELSGGQQQRTAVGRAIHKKCSTFFGDEPVSAVDEHQSRAVLESILEQHETVLLSMHDVGLALDFASRIVGLKKGRIVFDRPTAGMKPSDLYDLYID